MERQRHGGALRRGPPLATERLSSAPLPTELRETLRTAYRKNLAFLDQVIAGEVFTKIEYPVAALLAYAECPNCGEAGLALKDAAALVATIEVKVSPSVKDRLAAVDHQAKYGMGALKEVSVETVRERVAKTIAVIRETADEETALAIVAQLRPVWT